MLTEKYKQLPLNRIKVRDPFWSKYMRLIFDKVIPYQWEILNNRVEGAEPSYCIDNFKIAAGQAEGEFHGVVFQDTDAAKWLEAVAYRLSVEPDEKLEALADDVIELIAAAQQPDGYINTYFTIEEPGARWSNLQEGHELYTAGHLLEAAVAYYQATGKDRFLKIMMRFCDTIYDVFGTEEGKLRGYPGHQEIEVALVKLYQVTQERKYLELARYFIDERGKEPHIFDIQRKKLDHYLFPDFAGIDRANEQGHSRRRADCITEDDFAGVDRTYAQTYMRPAEQEEAWGHAVRAVYMYSAMADLAYEYRDEALMNACRKLYDNIVNRKMYITGSIGAQVFGESFIGDYDLPNDTNYSETCATVGMAMFANRMAQITGEAKYVDTVERCLYNTLLAGISLEGTEFFYVNPLEVWPDSCRHSAIKKHVKTVRQKWFGVACCPTNIARTVSSVGQYIYSADNKRINVNLFISNETDFTLNGANVRIQQKTNYPYGGDIRIRVTADRKETFAVAVRIPAWSPKAALLLNNSVAPCWLEKGYAIIEREWGDDEILLQLDVSPQLYAANPKVRADIGRTAIVKGPLVYCLEQADNGENLQAIQISANAELTEEYRPDLLGGTTVITCRAERISDDGQDELYRKARFKTEEAKLTAIPYCLWNNRGEGEMLVWIRTTTA